jgi:hypothetical protein
LVSAAANTAIDASVRSSYAAFSTLVADWANNIKRWRCGLSAAERTRLGVNPNWRCSDVSLFIDRVNFEQLGPARAGILNAVPTRFVLPVEQVDLLIQGGADALRQSRSYQAFRRRALKLGKPISKSSEKSDSYLGDVGTYDAAPGSLATRS